MTGSYSDLASRFVFLLASLASEKKLFLQLVFDESQACIVVICD